MQQWEYMTDLMHADDTDYMEHILALMGRDGWELGGVLQAAGRGGGGLTH